MVSQLVTTRFQRPGAVCFILFVLCLSSQSDEGLGRRLGNHVFFPVKVAFQDGPFMELQVPRFLIPIPILNDALSGSPLAIMEEILSFGLSLKTAFQIIPRERFHNASKICITQSLSIQGFPGIFSSIALMIVGQCHKVVSVWWQNVRMLAIPARTSSHVIDMPWCGSGL